MRPILTAAVLCIRTARQAHRSSIAGQVLHPSDLPTIPGVAEAVVEMADHPIDSGSLGVTVLRPMGLSSVVVARLVGPRGVDSTDRRPRWEAGVLLLGREGGLPREGVIGKERDGIVVVVVVVGGTERGNGTESGIEKEGEADLGLQGGRASIGNERLNGDDVVFYIGIGIGMVGALRVGRVFPVWGGALMCV
jgi:hypothetical protein